MRKRSLLLKLLVAATLVVGAIGLAGCDLTDMFHSHSWQAWVVDVEANCEVEGLKHRTCTSCGETEEMPVHPLGHDIEEYTYNEDATCLANGTKSGTCARKSCQKFVTVEATNTKLPHTYVQLATEEFLKKEATCTSKAVYYISCSECSSMEDLTFEYGEMKEHVFDREIMSDAFFVSSELCEGDYYYKSCKCGATSGETFLDTKSAEHLWGDGKVNKKPSQDKKEDGEICFECDNCGEENKKPMKPDDDEDEDGLNNWEEIWEHDCDPMKKDSDDDQLDDCEEVKEHKTNPNEKDSDGDDLDDCEEVKNHKTNPNNKDTDADGVKDGKEVDNQTDPNQFDDEFDVNFGYKPADPDEEKDVVEPFIKIEGLGKDQAESITIERDDFFSKDMLGYMGQAYKFFMNGGKPEHKAEIAFKFDKFDVTQHKQPWIYVFDELNKKLTPVTDTKIDGAVISTEVDELGTYILMNREVYEDENSGLNAWIDYFELNQTENTASAVQIVFVVDDSGSMYGNDSSFERLSVAKDLIDELPQNSEIGIVKFESSTTMLTASLTTDKTIAKNYLTTSYFSSNGGTRMYTAINDAFALYRTTTEDMAKMMVVLSDGQTDDTSMHSSVSSYAKLNGIKLYTVGLGSDSWYFDSYLKPLASETDANYYHSADASQLSNIYGDIQIKIDLSTDSDKDGLIDYYEKNPVAFNGVKYNSEIGVKDTDGDGLDDGDEVIVLQILSIEIKPDGSVVVGEKMMIIGSVISNPCVKDSDNDGIWDKKDAFPMNPDLH